MRFRALPRFENHSKTRSLETLSPHFGLKQLGEHRDSSDGCDASAVRGGAGADDVSDEAQW
jgi:hypothetical protein